MSDECSHIAPVEADGGQVEDGGGAEADVKADEEVAHDVSEVPAAAEHLHARQGEVQLRALAANEVCAHRSLSCATRRRARLPFSYSDAASRVAETERTASCRVLPGAQGQSVRYAFDTVARN